MSKTTDTEIKDLIFAIDRKIDLLTQKVDGIDETVKKLDGRIWGLVILILGACLTAVLKLISV
jgi:hypothetical protein